ncbi:hypothetical protein PMI02_03917 [Novosphingobium sp. AP12]|nr:hypothetical protein PMI02_03917 [Novosphingobium sp. AP12]
MNGDAQSLTAVIGNRRKVVPSLRLPLCREGRLAGELPG